MGSTAFGIDLSPQMVAQARQAYPDLRFEVGSMLALDLPDRCLGGIVAWYSMIHIPDEQLPQAFGEFFRVLAPGGYLMLAFQTALGCSTARKWPVTPYLLTFAGGSRSRWPKCSAGPA